MNYKTIDIALEIISDLEITDIAPGVINSWIKNHIGEFNNMIQGSYTVTDDTFEISPAISINEVSIIKKMYTISYYDRLIRTNLGASAFSSVVEITEDNNKVRLTNKTELGKIYTDLRRQTAIELKNMVDKYHQQSITPASVDGVDGSLPTSTFTTSAGYNPRNQIPL
jgi:hypothetical protein